MPLSVITAETVGRHVEALTALGPRHPEGQAVPATLRYLADELAAAGLAVEVERFGGDLHEVNLLAELPGGAGPAVELGAHWDTVPGSPGADDNASGVAGVLAAARALAAGDPPPRTVRFCLYAGEERGFLGSTAHVRRAAAGIAGAVVLEMIGYRSTEPGSQRLPRGAAALVPGVDRGDFIAAVGDPSSAAYLHAFERAAAAHAPDLAVRTLTVPGLLRAAVSRSDHVPYWRARRPAIMVTDTADYRNPHYHRASDVAQTLDLEFAAAVARAAAGAVVALAGG
jgi:Zn-dependent M28 family amino/carboxypeptidase